MRSKLFFIGLAASALTMLPGAFAEGAVTIELVEEFPLHGEAQKVTLVGAEAGRVYDLSVTYRPNSETAEEELVGRFGEDWTISWIPRIPGITSLQVLGSEGAVIASRNVATRFSSPPLSGILVFLLAGLLLFGGATYSMRRAL